MTDSHQVPVWPSGVMSFNGSVLEVTTGDGLRVAASDLEEIKLGKTFKGRVNVKIAYRAGLGKAKTGAWAEEEHEVALRELIAATE
jgi:hypothetical protein